MSKKEEKKKMNILDKLVLYAILIIVLWFMFNYVPYFQNQLSNFKSIFVEKVDNVSNEIFRVKGKVDKVKDKVNKTKENVENVVDGVQKTADKIGDTLDKIGKVEDAVSNLVPSDEENTKDEVPTKE